MILANPLETENYNGLANGLKIHSFLDQGHLWIYGYILGVVIGQCVSVGTCK